MAVAVKFSSSMVLAISSVGIQLRVSQIIDAALDKRQYRRSPKCSTL
jgi:hypothetical protein